MRRIRIGIRSQLIILVCCFTLVSLLILAVVTGVYFTSHFTQSRAERLEVVSQLKASQLEQSLIYHYYQIYWLSTRDAIEDALVSEKVGNANDSSTLESKNQLESFLDSSEVFVEARLYDLFLNQMANATTGELSERLEEILFPLDVVNATVPDELRTHGQLISGPVLSSNGTFFSLTLPVYANASIILNGPNLSGYLTAVISGGSYQSIVNSTQVLEDARASVFMPITNPNNASNVTGFRYAWLPEGEEPEVMNNTYPINSFAPLQQVYLNGGGSGLDSNIRTPLGEHMAIGWSGQLNQVSGWVVVVEQRRAAFLEPINSLIKIIVGTVIGIGAFMAIITFPLAHFGVRPIVKLQKATEDIAYGRGLGQRRRKHKKRRGEDPFSGLTSPTAEKSFSKARTSTGSSDSESRARAAVLRVPEERKLFKDELTELTYTFNTMTDELDRQYSNLEDRVKDRTRELEVAKVQAEAANEAKTVFIANISHELRTPLNGILGMTAVAMEEEDSFKVKESLRLISRSGELLLHILTELLTFSKNTLNRSKLEMRDFQIMEVVLQINSIFGKLAQDQNVRLSITVKPNVLRRMVFLGDSNRIIQVVMNLVSNALKFTPDSGSVSVDVKLLGEYDEERSSGGDHQHVFVGPNHRDSFSTMTTYQYESADTSHSSSSSHSDTEEQIVVDPPSNEIEPCNKKWVVQISVHDTGPGIDEKLQERVFEPFVQGDQTLSRSYGGTGLGLSICRQLATMMNGTLTLKSESGRGSTFFFRLPLLQTGQVNVSASDEAAMYDDDFNANETPSPVSREKSPERNKNNLRLNLEAIQPFSSKHDIMVTSSSFNNSVPGVSSYFDEALSDTERCKRLRILVAEDNSVNQEVIKRMLKLEGFDSVTLACDGNDAVEKFNEALEPFEIIFMDVQMPKLDGLGATKAIRATGKCYCPIIALTAFADESNVKVCLEAGMSGFLSKPVRRAQLKQIISEFSPRSRGNGLENIDSVSNE